MSAEDVEREDRTRRALLPIAMDLEAEFPGQFPYREPEGASDWFGVGSRGVFLPMWATGSAADDIVDMVNEVGEGVLMARWSTTGRGECDWPHCPRHPGSGHYLLAEVRAGVASWVCNDDDAVIAPVGQLAAVLGVEASPLIGGRVEVLSADGEESLVLSDRYRGPDLLGTRRYRVTLTFRGGSVSLAVWDDGEDLLRFLRELAAEWRGFEGERRYVSPGEDLFLEFTYDGHGLLRGTVTLAAEEPTWVASVEFSLGAGAHLDTALSELETFFG